MSAKGQQSRMPALIAIAACSPLSPLASAAESPTAASATTARSTTARRFPPHAMGQPVELINKQGLVVRRIDPEGDEKERIAKEAERGEEARGGSGRARRGAPQPRAPRHLHQREGHRGRARARPGREHKACRSREPIDALDQEARQATRRSSSSTSGKGEPPATPERRDHERRRSTSRRRKQLLDAKKKEAEASTRATTTTRSATRPLSRPRVGRALSLLAQDLVHLRRIRLALVAFITWPTSELNAFSLPAR